MASTSKKKVVSSAYGITGNRSKRRDPMVKKVIDLSNSGTIGVASRAASTIRRNLVRILNEYNVAALSEIAKDPNVVANYFINHNLYVKLLGDNIRFLDTAIRDTLAEYITTEIKIGLGKTTAVYPGYWSTENIYALVHTMVNVITLSDGPELGPYLSALRVSSPGTDITKADVANAPAMACMRFVEYNENKLYQYCVAVMNLTDTVIMKESNEYIPTMLRAAHGEPVTVKFVREFSEVLQKGTISALPSVVDTDDALTERFIDAFDTVLFGYAIVCLSQSGIRPELVCTLLDSPRRLSATYTEGKEGENWLSRDVTYVLRDGVQVIASVTFRIADIYAILEFYKAKPVQINRVGKSLKLFFDALIRGIISGVISGSLTPAEDRSTEESSSPEPEGDNK